jgi:hypothetical protein
VRDYATIHRAPVSGHSLKPLVPEGSHEADDEPNHQQGIKVLRQKPGKCLRFLTLTIVQHQNLNTIDTIALNLLHR